MSMIFEATGKKSCLLNKPRLKFLKYDRESGSLKVQNVLCGMGRVAARECISCFKDRVFKRPDQPTLTFFLFHILKWNLRALICRCKICFRPLTRRDWEQCRYFQSHLRFFYLSQCKVRKGFETGNETNNNELEIRKYIKDSKWKTRMKSRSWEFYLNMICKRSVIPKSWLWDFSFPSIYRRE